MAFINDIAVEQFETLTRFNLSRLLIDFMDFENQHRTNITDYYAGTINSPNEDSFRELERLLSEFNDLNNVIENNKERLFHTLYWELLECTSDINIALETIDNSSRWLRSAITRNDFSPGAEVEHTLRMFETLEDVSRTIQGSDDPQNEWTTIALRNDLTEEAYTAEGGIKLSFSFRNRRTIQIRSVVDTINQDTLYGKDFSRKIIFNTTDQDFVILSPRETIIQAVEVLSSLKQGDTPEFRTEGIQASLVVGSNRNSVEFPILLRQIFNTFQRDDTLKSLRVINISIKDDALFIEKQVETRLNEIITPQS